MDYSGLPHSSCIPPVDPMSSIPGCDGATIIHLFLGGLRIILGQYTHNAAESLPQLRPLPIQGLAMRPWSELGREAACQGGSPWDFSNRASAMFGPNNLCMASLAITVLAVTPMPNTSRCPGRCQFRAI